MTVKIIADNIIESSHFSSATQQGVGTLEQPVPDSGNTGSFRLVSTGDIEDFSFSGTADSDGVAGGTTVIDSSLNVYGDEYFVGGTVAITDFLQDTGDYTESDTAGRVALTDANTITVTDLDDDEEAWVYIDMTAGHFDGDFEFHVQVNCTANAGAYDRCGVWAVTNTVDTLNDIDAANQDYIAVYWTNALSSDGLVLQECTAGAIQNDASIVLSKATEYYLKIKRDESVGTYGTVYCYIYSDSSMETLVDTLSLALSEKEDFRYLFWMIAAESGSTGAAWDGTIKNLEIVKSESKSVSDFAQSTGTLTTGAFTYQVNSGTEFTLTVDAETRDFRIELTNSGDAGGADFRWSHNGGTTYFGRDDPNQATWLANTQIVAHIGSTKGNSFLVQDDNDDLLCIYESTDSKLKVAKSTDNGISFSVLATINDADNFPYHAIKLMSGRILVSAWDGYFYYSDDNGVTWNSFVSPNTMIGIYEIDKQTLSATINNALADSIWFRKSVDGGLTWSDTVIIVNESNVQKNGDIVKCNDGALFCVYETNEDAISDYELKGKRSTDNGATWGTAIDVLDIAVPGGNDITNPRIVKDINGDLFVVASEAAGGLIIYVKSTDNGLTWGSKTTVADGGGASRSYYPHALLVDGHQLLCCYAYDQSSPSSIKLVRRGMWEAFSANACPTAQDAIEQKLICDVGLKWYGGAGIDGDIWVADDINYDYAMSNIIIPSPSRPWRSTSDNAACNIVLNAGTGLRFRCTGVSFFGANVRTLSFQMNASDSWGSPSVDESISFDLESSGTIDAVDGNYVQDTSLMANYKDHELSKKGRAERYFFRATSGTESGNTWEILDNVGDYIVIDASAATTLSAADTFVIFQSSISATFTGGTYQYIRLAVDAQQTADDYYQIGTMVAGLSISLTDDWGIGYGRDHIYDIDLMNTPAGGIYPIKGADRKRSFNLVWKANQTTRDEVLAISDFTEARPISLIPDGGTLTDCYLLMQSGNIMQNHRFRDNFDFSIKLIEVI